MTSCSTANSFARITEATYTVEVRDRYTGETVCTLDEGEGVFSRKLDGRSGAEWTTFIDSENGEGGCTSPDGASGGCPCEVQERRHELAFIREDWPEPAWIGPILRTVDDSDQGTVRYVAADRLFWWEGAEADRDFVYQAPNEIDIILLMEELMASADRFEDSNLHRGFRGDELPPSPGLQVESKATIGSSLWSELVAKAKSVMDFTVVGEQLYWGSPEIPIEDGPTILPIHFQNPPILDRDAEAVTTKVVVTGAGGITGQWPANEDVVDFGYGFRTEFISDTNLNTSAEATARAKEIYEANVQPTTFIITGQGSLSAAFPQPLHELIPGRNYLVVAEGQCMESADELVQLFNLVVELRTEAEPSKRIKETRVAADFGKPGSEGGAERQSG